MTRGFITMATGKELYYELARNLLMSYRLYSQEPLPFAILCDRENAYTESFDDVVLLEQPKFNYWDKLEFLVHSPYDETIFIDSDCLAYDDLNKFWDYFAGADDFAGAGNNYPFDSEEGPFRTDKLGKYEGKVHWIPFYDGGLSFIRKGKLCTELYEECQYIFQHYDEFHWSGNSPAFADEPVMCLAMAAHGMKAIEDDNSNFGRPWIATEIEFDIFTGKCSYAQPWHEKLDHGKMLHFGTRYCQKPPYLFEVEKLNLMMKYHITPPPEKLSSSGMAGYALVQMEVPAILAVDQRLLSAGIPEDFADSGTSGKRGLSRPHSENLLWQIPCRSTGKSIRRPPGWVMPLS